jgi:lysophospholipase L1-like esterase
MKIVLNRFEKMRFCSKKTSRFVLRTLWIICLGAGWLFPVLAAQAQMDSGTYFLYSRRSGLNLAPSGGGTGNGTPLVQSNFTGASNLSQQWTLTALGSGQYSMKGVASGRSIDVNGGVTTNAANCVLWDYTGSNHQKITLQGRSSGFYSLVFVHSGKAMNVYGGSTAAGVNIVQYTNDGGWNSQWKFYSLSRLAYPQKNSSWMPKFLENVNATKGKQYNLIFDGDSITEFWKGTGLNVWNANWAPKGACNFGLASDKVENLRWRLLQGETEGLNPKLVVLLIGTNNTGTEDAAFIQSKIITAVNDYLAYCPSAHILLLGILPRGQFPGTSIRNKIIDINNRISSLNGSGGGRVIYKDIGSKLLQPDGTLSQSIMPDYLHPSAQGYQIIADNIRSIVNTYVP